MEAHAATHMEPKAKRAHRFLVPTLLVVATLVWIGAAFAVWVNRQALNTDNWTKTSGKLLASKKVDDALGAYLVNQLFQSVDVAAVLQQQLPAQARALAGPVAGGLRELANRAAPELLARPEVRNAWVASNRVAHKELLRIVDGGGPVVSTRSGEVSLNLHALVDRLASSLGLESQVAAARSKLQGGAGKQARGAVQQKLGVTLPPATGNLVIMRAKQLQTAQDVAKGIRHLAIVLPALAILLFALAVWLARGRRRQTLRSVGWCFVFVGILILLLRRVVGNEVVDTLVKIPSNKPAVHEVWSIATSLLRAIAVALTAYGVLIVLSAILAGPSRAATWTRKALAPFLRDHAAASYAVVGGALLLVVVWGPTPAFRQLAWIALFAALLALGVAMLRRQTAVEFAGVQRGDAIRDLRGSQPAAGARRHAATTAPAAARTTPVGGDAGERRLEEIERLAELHDRGALTDDEFAAQKTALLNES